MRETVSLLLVFNLVFPIGPLAAEEPETLEERLSDMYTEAVRFLETKSPYERMLLHAVVRQGSTPTLESEEAARLRARILLLSSGSEIYVLLRDGQL